MLRSCFCFFAAAWPGSSRGGMMRPGAVPVAPVRPWLWAFYSRCSLIERCRMPAGLYT